MTEVAKSSEEILTELFDSIRSDTSTKNIDDSSPVKSPLNVKSKKKRKKEKKRRTEDKEKNLKKRKCKKHKRKTDLSSNGEKSKKKKKIKHSSVSSENEVEHNHDQKKRNVEIVKHKSVDREGTTDIEVYDTSNIPLPPVNGEKFHKEPIEKECSDARKVLTRKMSDVFENDNTDKKIRKPQIKTLGNP